MELPKYQCHKIVGAVKIARIYHASGAPRIETDETGFEGTSIALPPDFMERHRPEVGGYLVEYEDGYMSFSPAAAFEGGYTRIAAPKASAPKARAKKTPAKKAGQS